MKKIIANSLLQIKHQEEEQGSVDLIQRSQPFKFSNVKTFCQFARGHNTKNCSQKKSVLRINKKDIIIIHKEKCMYYIAI